MLVHGTVLEGCIALCFLSFKCFLQGCLLYNEYIVYNVDQIRMRYLIQVNFNFNRWLESECNSICAADILVLYQ